MREQYSSAGNEVLLDTNCGVWFLTALKLIQMGFDELEQSSNDITLNALQHINEIHMSHPHET
jgi:hypothetical protein